MGFLTTLVGTGAAPYVVRAGAHKPPVGWSESLDATPPATQKAVIASTPRAVRVTNCSADHHGTVIAQNLPTSASTDPVVGWMRLEPLASVLVETPVVELVSYAPLGVKHVFLVEPAGG